MDEIEKDINTASEQVEKAINYGIGKVMMHPLYGIGTVEKVEEKDVLGKVNKFAIISFQNDR